MICKIKVLCFNGKIFFTPVIVAEDDLTFGTGLAEAT